MATILVTGGTGTLGRQIVVQAQQAHHVRVLSRRPEPVGPRDFGWATGDLMTGNGVFQSLEGVDVIIHCATSNGSSDLPAAQNLIDAARNAGTPHLIYVSIVGVEQIPLPYYRTKRQVEELLLSAGLGVTVQRATQFHDLIATIAKAQRRLPWAIALKDTLFQPVSTSDVASRVLDLAGGTPQGLTPDFGGPEIVPMKSLIAQALIALGKNKRILEISLPGAIARGYANGYHLAPVHRDGTITFEDYLASA